MKLTSGTRPVLGHGCGAGEARGLANRLAGGERCWHFSGWELVLLDQPFLCPPTCSLCPPLGAGKEIESMIQSRGKGSSQRTRGAGFAKGQILFLARPRVLRGRMCKGLVLIKSPHLTKRALDAGDSARFSSFFLALAFFSVDGFAVPPPQRE